MANVQLNYSAIVNSIRKQIEDLKIAILNDDEYATNPFYAEISPLIRDFNFYVDDEQSMIKNKDKIDPNGVYVAVRFGRASINFGASACSISLVILGSGNKIKPTQMFFSAFASKYTTLEFDNANNTQQIWVTPSVQTNFNEFADEFRSLFEVSGTIIIGSQTVSLLEGKIIYKFDGGMEEIPVLSFQDSYNNNLSPQPFGNTFGFSKSETNFSTYTFTFSTYLTNTQLVADCMKMRGFKQIGTGKTSEAVPNKNFEMRISFSNGYSNTTSESFFRTFKLVSCGITHQYGEIPMFTASFTH